MMPNFEPTVRSISTPAGKAPARLNGYEDKDFIDWAERVIAKGYKDRLNPIKYYVEALIHWLRYDILFLNEDFDNRMAFGKKVLIEYFSVNYPDRMCMERVHVEQPQLRHKPDSDYQQLPEVDFDLDDIGDDADAADLDVFFDEFMEED